MKASPPPAADNRIDSEVLEQAAAWLARLRADDASMAERERFAAWRRLKPEHARACDALTSLWQDADLDRALMEALPQVTRARCSPWPRLSAAALVAALLLASDLRLMLLADYRTGVGEQSVINLPDASCLTLNTNSAVDIDFADGQRHVRLLAGEAYFEVKRDPEHPFVVASRYAETQVKGTRFAVTREGTTDSVAVVEGVVEVRDTHGGTALLEADRRIGVGPDGAGAVAKTPGMAAIAWREGFVLFDNVTLADVTAELARYRRGTVLIRGEALKALRVSGRFDIRNTDRALDSLAQTLPIRLRRLTPLLVLVD